LIGNFANRGQIWTGDAIGVNAHDFRSDAECIAAPYGIYDVTRNTGFVFIGTSSDTPEFAVDAIRQWWLRNKKHYPRSRKLLILADSGGSNGCRPRLFKKMLQEKMADEFGIKVSVSHYPTGTSKWNPIEHKLFGPISNNWAGVPLTSLSLMIRFIRETKNKSGLSVSAILNRKTYSKGRKVSDREMIKLNIKKNEVCPKWNYSIMPRAKHLN